MDYSALDTLRIVGLEVECIIGTLLNERLKPQTVLMDITLKLDLSAACESDDLNCSVDYADLQDEISRSASASEFLLIERLAAMVADICLARQQVQAATVCVSKPNALESCKTVQVEITRTR